MGGQKEDTREEERPRRERETEKEWSQITERRVRFLIEKLGGAMKWRVAKRREKPHDSGSMCKNPNNNSQSNKKQPGVARD